MTKQIHSAEHFFKKQITKTGCAECHGSGTGAQEPRGYELRELILGVLRTPAKGLLETLKSLVLPIFPEFIYIVLVSNSYKT